jgi:hypothetical protein
VNNLVCKSYFDAIEAEEDVETLIATGYRRSDISVALSDRGRHRYREESAPRGLRRESIIAEVLLEASPSGVLHAICLEGDEDVALVTVRGPLALHLTENQGTAGSNELLDVLLAAGVSRRVAEHLLQDVLRGGILVAVRVQSTAAAIVQHLLGTASRLSGMAMQPGFSDARWRVSPTYLA